jgi:hypothetical protein
MGILGVEPRLSPYKEPALTIKLYSHEYDTNLSYHIRPVAVKRFLNACLRFLAARRACGLRCLFCSLLLWCCQFGTFIGLPRPLYLFSIAQDPWVVKPLVEIDGSSFDRYLGSLNCNCRSLTKLQFCFGSIRHNRSTLSKTKFRFFFCNR